MKSSETLDKLAPAIAKAQAELKHVKKDSDNPFFSSSYASLEAVIDATREVRGKYGLSVIQSPGGNGDVVVVETRLLHESGQWIETETAVKPVPAKIDRGSAEKAVTPQATGSAITYAKRYGYMALFGLAASDDDDGNAASRTERVAEAPQEDYGTFEATIKDVRQTKRGEFVVYTIETDSGEKLGTLSKDLALQAKSFKGTGETLVLDTEPSKYGPQIKSIMRKE